jgi:DNA-binding HxlR family transcriptional regulator
MQQKQRQIPDPWNSACPSRELLNLLGDKWTLLLFPVLQKGPSRTSEILRSLDGISQKVLTDKLRELESQGLICRRDYRTVPPKVDYRLTDLGTNLAKAITVLDRWVVEHYYEVADARERFKRRTGRKASRQREGAPV